MLEIREEHITGIINIQKCSRHQALQSLFNRVNKGIETVTLKVRYNELVVEEIYLEEGSIKVLYKLTHREKMNKIFEPKIDIIDINQFDLSKLYIVKLKIGYYTSDKVFIQECAKTNNFIPSHKI